MCLSELSTLMSRLKCPMWFQQEKFRWKLNITPKRYIDAIKLYECLGSRICVELPGFHSFTGCDYTASFNRRPQEKYRNTENGLFSLVKGKEFLAGKWMLLKILIGKQVLSVISAYVPQQGLSNEVKERFYADLVFHTSKIDEKEIISLGGGLNGHVGKTISGYEDVHGGFGYGVRNAEGERILEFVLALDMVVCNTLFQKRSSRLITFSSGGSNTQIDYTMMKTRDKKNLKDVKDITGEEVFIQHKLVACDLSINIKKEKKKPYVPKLKMWKLKDTLAR